MLEVIAPTSRITDLRSGRALDRAALSEAVAQRASALYALGARPRTLIAICREDSLALLLDLFAAWQLGAAALVLPPSLPLIERRRIGDWAKPVCWSGAAGEGDGPHPGRDAGADPPAHVEPDDPALVLLTSGSTGHPKGVVLSYRALSTRLAANVAHIGHAKLGRSLAPLPLHFGHGLIGNCLTSLAAGGTLLLWTEPGIEGLARLGSVIDDNEITFLSSVPSMWRVALKLATPPGRGLLRRVHVGSEPLPAELWRKICGWAGTQQVFNMYGMTEAANWISGVGAFEAGLLDGAVGRPWSGRFHLLREDGAITGRGQGEILLQDPGLMSGYLHDPAATSGAFVDGWFRTGDIGELDGEGRLRIVGRVKNQINRGGVKVSPEEIEIVLEQHPAIQEACAFGVPDPVSGEAVAAAVVARAGGAPRTAELQSWCSERLRREAIPGRIVVLPALPRSDRGKLLRGEVKRLAMNDQGKAA